MVEIKDEDLQVLGQRVIKLVDDGRFKKDHLAFKTMIYMLVDHLKTQKDQPSARYLSNLTGIALGCFGGEQRKQNIVIRLIRLGYITVRKIKNDARIPPIVTINYDAIDAIEIKDGQPCPYSFILGGKYRITVEEVGATIPIS